jgi:hypothetical protein
MTTLLDMITGPDDRRPTYTGAASASSLPTKRSIVLALRMALHVSVAGEGV